MGKKNVFSRLFKTILGAVGVFVIMMLFNVPAYAAETSESDSVSLSDLTVVKQIQQKSNEEGISFRGYVDTGNAHFELLLPTGQTAAHIDIDFEYEYADGSWARINNANVTKGSLSGFLFSNIYNERYSSGSDYGIYSFNINLKYDGNVAQYYCFVTCDIYGNINGGCTFKGMV